MVEFHSLKAHPLEKAQNHPLEKAQNAMAAPAKNASASRGLPVCPEQPPALGQLINACIFVSMRCGIRWGWSCVLLLNVIILTEIIEPPCTCSHKTRSKQN